MRFQIFIPLVSLAMVAMVESTPPACVLQCVNAYARWCPSAHRDIPCICNNSQLLIGCLGSDCLASNFESARDHYLGVCLELLENPPLPPPQLITPPLPTPTPTPPVKHKPPKYGYRKSKTFTTKIKSHTQHETLETPVTPSEAPTENLDVITQTTNTGVVTDAPIEQESHLQQLSDIQLQLESLTSESIGNEGSGLYDDHGDNRGYNNPEGKRDVPQAISNKQMANPEQPLIKTYKRLPVDDKDVEDPLELSDLDIEVEANLQYSPHLPNFSGANKLYGRKTLPNFSKKKLVNRNPTDQALGVARVRSQLRHI